MSQYAFPVALLAVSNIIFWFKGNSKALYGIEWSPFRWWLTTSLMTNYLTLIAWWRMIEIGDVWKAGGAWGIVSLTVDLILNSVYFGFNYRGALALVLCATAGVIAHK